MKNPFTFLLKKLFTADYPYCIYCGKEYGVDEKTLACPACAAKLPAGMDEGQVFGFNYTACYQFDGPVRNLIHRYKYNGERYLGERLAMLMQQTMQQNGVEAQGIVNVPLHKNKRKKRGYDQSRCMARALAERTGIPYIEALKRNKDTVSQTHLTREERLENVKDVFAVKENIAGLRLLLIDDVLTTGSTACECARSLIKAGAKEVRILVFAKAL